MCFTGASHARPLIIKRVLPAEASECYLLEQIKGPLCLDLSQRCIVYHPSDVILHDHDFVLLTASNGPGGNEGGDPPAMHAHSHMPILDPRNLAAEGRANNLTSGKVYKKSLCKEESCFKKQWRYIWMITDGLIKKIVTHFIYVKYYANNFRELGFKNGAMS